VVEFAVVVVGSSAGFKKCKQTARKFDFFNFLNDFFRYLPNRGQKNAPRRNH